MEHQSKTMKKQIEALKNQIKGRDNEIDDLVNRTMRINIVVKGIPEGPKED